MGTVLRWDDLTINIESIDWHSAMACWFWLIDDGLTPFLMSSIGDAFFMDDNEAIFWLDTGEGELKKIASSLDEFNDLLHEKEKLYEWFLPSVIEEMLASGHRLKPGQCYHYKVPPLVGGEYNAENFETADIVQHFHITGLVAEQASVLPDGSPVEMFLEN